jgi:D-glycero-D-manno-heptose 1,7-bisphosphate phosphatase
MNDHSAVFLDRDGVLNAPVSTERGHRPPWKIEELVVEPAAPAALQSLHRAGYLLIVVTNQPDIAAGRLDAVEADHINRRLAEVLRVDEIVVCPHATEEHCRCKKPAAGMLLDSAGKWSIDLSRSWMVGDRWVDIAAGRAAGVRTVLIENESSWSPTSAGAPPSDLVPDATAAGIATAASYILHADTSGVTPPRLP